MDRLLAWNGRRWRVTTLALLAAVTALSLAPLPALPPAPPGGDKTHHLIAYAALAGPVALAGPRGWGWVIAGLLGWSGAIELVQPLVNRWRELGDLAANGAGLALGAAAGAALRRLSRRRGRPEAGSG